MRREEKFVLSHRPYAVDLGSLHIGDGPVGSRASVAATWFRRRRGVTVACLGELWSYQTPSPATALEFLGRHVDGRYGGNTAGRWDGHGYWGERNPDIMAEHLAILRPMLAAFPAPPNGYDGWWTFRE